VFRTMNRAHISLPRSTLVWGAIYGALWSLAPGILGQLLSLSRPGETATVVLTGVLTGVLVSCRHSDFYCFPWLCSQRCTGIHELSYFLHPICSSILNEVRIFTND
jgi:hypothetical protein